MKRHTNHLVQRAFAQRSGVKRLRIENGVSSLTKGGIPQHLPYSRGNMMQSNETTLRYYINQTNMMKQTEGVKERQNKVELDFENAYNKIDDY